MHSLTPMVSSVPADVLVPVVGGARVALVVLVLGVAWLAVGALVAVGLGRAVAYADRMQVAEGDLLSRPTARHTLPAPPEEQRPARVTASVQTSPR